MRIDFLFEQAQLVANADNFVEKDFQRHFFGLEGWIGGMQDELTFMPARPKLLDDGVRPFEAEFLNRRVNGLLNKLGQGDVESVDGGLRFRWLYAAGFR